MWVGVTVTITRPSAMAGSRKAFISSSPSVFVSSLRVTSRIRSGSVESVAVPRTHTPFAPASGPFSSRRSSSMIRPSLSFFRRLRTCCRGAPREM